MARQWNDRETWEDAATRAAHRAVEAGLSVEALLSEATRRARSYARRVRGVTPREAVRRAFEYREWYLDLALTNSYDLALDQGDEQQADAADTALQALWA